MLSGSLLLSAQGVTDWHCHAILDAAPLLSLPRWLLNPLRHYQAANVWTCYHWTGFWKRVFHSHYFDVLLDECRKSGGTC